VAYDLPRATTHVMHTRNFPHRPVDSSISRRSEDRYRCRSLGVTCCASSRELPEYCRLTDWSGVFSLVDGSYILDLRREYIGPYEHVHIRFSVGKISIVPVILYDLKYGEQERRGSCAVCCPGLQSSSHASSCSQRPL
jgi:hypothetical protein